MLIRSAAVAGQIVDLRCRAGRIDAIAPTLAPRGDEEVLEAEGGALLPGLHDHHLHLFAFAAAHASAACGPPATRDAEALRRALAAAPVQQGWRRGVGYFESVAGPLDRARLDALAPPGPVRVQHRSGILWHLNSAAIDALGLDDPAAPRATRRFEGIERDGAGRATGRLFRADAWLRERLPPNALPDLRAAAHALARLGITSFTDTTATHDLAAAQSFAEAQARGDLPQRVRLMGGASLDDLEAPEARALFAHRGSDGRLVRDARKFLLDEPALPALDELVAEIARVHRAGRGCAFHCVTRSELFFALAALEAAGVTARDRIEHAAVAPDEAIETIRRLGLRVVTQPNFIFERGDDYRAEVDPRDQPSLYRLQSWLDAGVALAAGSDAPYGDPDPWRAMRAAVERTTRTGAPLGPAERLTPEAALALYSPSFDPPEPLREPPREPRPNTPPPAAGPRVGDLQVGAAADLCLLDRPWQAARTALAAERVVATVCNGVLLRTSDFT